MERAGSQAQRPTEGGPPEGPAIEPGAVRLRVADLALEGEFYERVIGLQPLEVNGEVTRLGVDGTAVVELHPSATASPRPSSTTGLFHLAIVVPGRAALARALAHVVGAGWRLSGASDHLVSEALYLSDPEDNGIEIYRDRPRSEWRYDGDDLQMSTLPLDLDGLISEVGVSRASDGGMEAGTRIGHVHLNVADLGDAEEFYAGVLGFDVTVRGYPGALFLSTGGYHHHIGLNTWAGPGASPPPEDSRGLVWFELEAEGPAVVDELSGRLERAGAEVEALPAGIHTRDPSGNGVLIRTAAA
ncbi:MAG: VOC family protein [Solirubrobacterales bacterium]